MISSEEIDSPSSSHFSTDTIWRSLSDHCRLNE